MSPVQANHATGNPNAVPVRSQPDAVVSGNVIAPAPPGGPSFWDTHCGVTKGDGTRCHHLKGKYWDTCIGHRPRKRKSDDTD